MVAALAGGTPVGGAGTSPGPPLLLCSFSCLISASSAAITASRSARPASNSSRLSSRGSDTHSNYESPRISATTTRNRCVYLKSDTGDMPEWIPAKARTQSSYAGWLDREQGHSSWRRRRPRA